MKTMEWEKIEDRGSDITYRAAVPGGWFVQFYEHIDAADIRSNVLFYPDPDHEWDGGSIEVKKPDATE